MTDFLVKPRIIENLYELDISSAYPYAMTMIPQMIRGHYAHVSAYDPDHAGVYRVSGEDRGRYPLIFDHAFKRLRGPFRDVWTTGYELGRALRRGSKVNVKVHEGWTWVHDRGYKHNPLVEYVEHFYKLKQAAPKSDAGYYFYKTCMNALYGKFCQTTEVRRLDVLEASKAKDRDRIPVDYAWDSALGSYVSACVEWRAGGLYNPFLATQITGFVRAYLYDLEVSYDACHSATDSIKTLAKVPAIKGLGGLKVEIFGRCWLFRNKLYLHFAKDFSNCHHDPKVTDPTDPAFIKGWDGEGKRRQHLCKYALHGFKGGVEDLLAGRHKLMKGRAHHIEYKHMVGLREGLRLGEEPCKMVDREEEFKV